ncbi:hypothetical protein [Gemmobacter sp.]|uniref:hypothetical protein n=1 Tax=Gemmobacter sp. TaxID=1898957 RepID=UPI002AFE2D0C|nr:hypothetical protein [Gemmobacter sp.]
MTGKGNAISMTAFATLKRTGKRVSITLDLATAKAEGWTKNSRCQSIPEQMLRYRTAAFLIRLYCPEVMIAMPMAIEHALAPLTAAKHVADELVQARSDETCSPDSTHGCRLGEAGPPRGA